jgi:hypothetical protein
VFGDRSDFDPRHTISSSSRFHVPGFRFSGSKRGT